MELRDVWTALRRWWYVIVLTTLVAGAIAVVVARSAPAMYTATAQGFVSVTDPQNRPPYALASGAQYILSRMTSYAELGVTTPVLAPVVDDLRLDETPLSLSGRISSHSSVGKAVVEVAVTYNDPKTAAAIADHVLAGLGQKVAELERGNVEVKPMGAAEVPASPSNKHVVLNGAVAAAGGLALGCLIALLLQAGGRYRTRRFQRPTDDLAESTQ